jgi:hypothetical protein
MWKILSRPTALPRIGPTAFWVRVDNYGQFWAMLGKVISPIMLYTAVKPFAVGTRVAWSPYQDGGSDQQHLSCHHCFWPQIPNWAF